MYKSQKDKYEAIRISEIFQAFALDERNLQYEREGNYNGEKEWQTYFPSVAHIIRDLYNNINIRIAPEKGVDTSLNPKDKNMKDEQQKSKELAELLNAFSEGKQLEAMNSLSEWEIFIPLDVASVYAHFPYVRIKPETKRVPLTQQDLIDRIKEGKTMWVKLDFRIALITDFHDDANGDNRVYFQCDQQSYSELMNYTFLDGTPCYKEVSCE